MDASTTSARYQGGIGEPSASALFRAEASRKPQPARAQRNEELVDDLMRKESRLVRARFDVAMGGYTRFI
jgi:hypothetical protein